MTEREIHNTAVRKCIERLKAVSVQRARTARAGETGKDKLILEVLGHDARSLADDLRSFLLPPVTEATETPGPTREQAIAMLAECYRLTGADPDGNEDWRLAEQAVDKVREMRERLDGLEGVF